MTQKAKKNEENEKKRKQHVFASKVDANGLNARKLSQNGRKNQKGELYRMTAMR
jgi:CRISPR/Cas system CSM-associated protein Csm4 (group 5 of RAMP superfamily)